MPFTLTMPKLSPTMEEGTVVKWHKKEGEFVKAEGLLLEIATDKATVEYEILDEGWLRKILIKEGDSAVVNEPIAILTAEKDESIEGYKPEGEVTVSQEEEKVTAVTEEKVAAPKAKGIKMSEPAFVPEEPLKSYAFASQVEQKQILASPLAKKLAKEQGLDLSTVKGSGPGGRIVKKDLEKAQKNLLFSFTQTRTVPEKQPGTFDEVALTQMRKAIAKRLQEAKTYIPHFYVDQVIDAEPLVKFRQQLKNLHATLSFNDCIIKASALALRQHPEVNSGFNSVNQTLVRFKTIDVAVAVSIEGGLITPIIRHADYKSLGEISLEVKQLAERARQGKLKLEEFRGGSFTLSNLGMYGITQFQAILSPPQAAVLAVGGIADQPVVKENQVVPGKVMHLTLSSDHRVIDGELAAKFLQTVKRYLENPPILLS